MNRRRVVLESPFAGKTPEETERNRAYALLCLHDSLLRGEAPLASHLLYTQVLDDGKPNERAIGIAAGLSWVACADASVVYIDFGISNGMKRGVDAADANGRPVEYRHISAEALASLSKP